MNENPLDRLAKAHGLQLSYRSETGEWRHPTDDDKRAVLAAMGVAVEEDVMASSFATAPKPIEASIAVPERVRCFMPDWLAEGRAWGVTCQLYGLRSARNLGIGDFEDLARLAERIAAVGADFIGVNPVHALFTAEPERCSPFSPSNRRFLNPLYIAIDRIRGIGRLANLDEAACAAVRSSEWVDYAAVSALKLGALRAMWRQINENGRRWDPEDRSKFEAFVEAGGASLRAHALFEALSHHMVAGGKSSGWHGWPEAYRNADSEAVRRLAVENDGEVQFHLWLQWIADSQLGAAAKRARDAGMRIGIYLDFAVGTAPDGSATWTDPALVVPGANIGAPPDAFFTAGQDWGLAPFSPVELRARDIAPYRSEIAVAMRHAGALRIDHVMGLHRLFWIPHGRTPSQGCYVLYPLADMVCALAKTSVEHATIVIGEDLGTVPKGFSERMQNADVLSCRVLYFERMRGGFRAAASYRKNAFLSTSTHDLPPLAAWWKGDDIRLFQSLGLIGSTEAARRRKERRRDRQALVARLQKQSARRALPFAPSAAVEATAPTLTRDLAVNVHAFLARTPSRLLGLQFEDLCGAEAPVNVPGTSDEYPNWRLRAPVGIEVAADGALWSSIIDAVVRERPRYP